MSWNACPVHCSVLPAIWQVARCVVRNKRIVSYGNRLKNMRLWFSIDDIWWDTCRLRKSITGHRTHTIISIKLYLAINSNVFFNITYLLCFEKIETWRTKLPSSQFICYWRKQTTIQYIDNIYNFGFNYSNEVSVAG